MYDKYRKIYCYVCMMAAMSCQYDLKFGSSARKFVVGVTFTRSLKKWSQKFDHVQLVKCSWVLDDSKPKELLAYIIDLVV